MLSLDDEVMTRLTNELQLTGIAPSASTPQEKKFVADIIEDIADMREMAERGGPDVTVDVVA